MVTKEEKTKLIDDVRELLNKKKEDKLRFEFRKYYYSMVNVEIGEGYKPMRREFLSSWPDE